MVAMIRLAAREGAGFGIDPTRLAVGGDSAGANLALGAALAMRDAGETALRFQLLIYGCFSTDIDSPSWQRFGQGAGLVADPDALDLADLSRKTRAMAATGAPHRFSPTSLACRRHI